VQHCEYTPYGSFAVNAITQERNNAITHFYTGKELDSTGLYYYGARFYSHELGRFITPDTIVQAPYDPQSLNRYSYCRNNPINYVDPTGHKWSWKKFWHSVVSGVAAGVTFVVTGGNFVLAGMVAGAVYGGLEGGARGALIGATIGAATGGIASIGTPFAIATFVAGIGYTAATQGWEGLGYMAGSIVGSMVGASATNAIGEYLSSPRAPNLATERGSAQTARNNKATNNLNTDQKPSPKLKTNYDIEGKAKSFDLVYDNESVSYPLNRGFQGPPERMTLQLGTLVDRYGPPSGRFVSPQGVSAAARSLPPGVANAQLNTYQVLKPFDVYGGPTAPAFNQPGGGTQYFLDRTVHDLIKQGYLGEVD
jgi:RHS repeat-associated protein